MHGLCTSYFYNLPSFKTEKFSNAMKSFAKRQEAQDDNLGNIHVVI